MSVGLASSVEMALHRNGPREVQAVVARNHLENREILPLEGESFWVHHIEKFRIEYPGYKPLSLMLGWERMLTTHFMRWSRRPVHLFKMSPTFGRGWYLRSTIMN